MCLVLAGTCLVRGLWLVVVFSGGLDRLGIAASRIRGSSGLGLGVLASSYIEDLCILPVSLYLVSLLSAVPYN